MEDNELENEVAAIENCAVNDVKNNGLYQKGYDSFVLLSLRQVYFLMLHGTS